MHDALARRGRALCAIAICALALASCGQGKSSDNDAPAVQPGDTTLAGGASAHSGATAANSVDGICERARQRLIAIGVDVFEHHRDPRLAVIASARESRAVVQAALAQIRRHQAGSAGAANALVNLERHRAQLESLEAEVRSLSPMSGEQLIHWLELLRERANGCTERKPHA